MPNYRPPLMCIDNSAKLCVKRRKPVSYSSGNSHKLFLDWKMLGGACLTFPGVSSTYHSWPCSRGWEKWVLSIFTRASDNFLRHCRLLHIWFPSQSLLKGSSQMDFSCCYLYFYLVCEMILFKSFPMLTSNTVRITTMGSYLIWL